jgi:hypothetical protein
MIAAPGVPFLRELVDLDFVGVSHVVGQARAFAFSQDEPVDE